MALMQQGTLPPVSVVIIGRNEADNIKECIMSAKEMDYPQELLEIIYVDTGSTDGTQDIARTAGINVVVVSSPAPSAALARNTGLKESNHQIIHFVDGDMTIDPGYLIKAVTRLSGSDMGSVIGRVIERHADTNWISRMLNIDWKKKEEGYISAPGGGGTFIRAALEKIGGYNSALPMAEETDVGIRLGSAGYRIYLINDVMAAHDYGVKSLWELIKRFYASGKGRFRILVCDNVPPEIRKWSWSLPKQAAAAIAAISLLLLSGYTYAIIILLLSYPVIYLPRVVISDWKNIVTRKFGMDAFLYTYTYGLMKPVILLGMIRESVVYAVKRLQ
ncbi:MAG: glycosyltransferase [Deltaproteobacteria bacterium]|nr:glycosyltransferase [Deltaproteobacteria bacterium]